MDLIEPYDYKALEDFQTKYMSGFFAEKYNMDATELGPRAKDKAKADAKAIMNKTVTGYSTITNRTDNVTMRKRRIMPCFRSGVIPISIKGRTTCSK